MFDIVAKYIVIYICFLVKPGLFLFSFVNFPSQEQIIFVSFLYDLLYSWTSLAFCVSERHCVYIIIVYLIIIPLW